jgi:hypothetical protein
LRTRRAGCQCRQSKGGTRHTCALRRQVLLLWLLRLQVRCRRLLLLQL